MLPTYEDIRSKIDSEPIWFDGNGVPRYNTFEPNMLGIYDHYAILVEIACQSCREKFFVGVGAQNYMFICNEIKTFSLSSLIDGFHYGDPPRHGCVGDTMNCDDLRVVEAWHRDSFEWERVPELEGNIV